MKEWVRRFTLLATAVLLWSPSGSSAQATDRSGEDAGSPLTHFLQQAFDSQTALDRQALNHLGMETIPVAQGWVVTAVLGGFPAQTAGIRRGDIVVAADGAPFDPVISLNGDVPADSFSPRTSSIQIELLRNGEALQVSAMPVFGNLFDAYRTAMVNSLQQISVGNKVVGYLHWWAFSRSTNDMQVLQQLLYELRLTDGIILDLRNSYGFHDPQHSAFFRVRSDSRLANNPWTLFYGKPLAILTNRWTRGGAEILAADLMGLDRAEVIGEPTAGWHREATTIDTGLPTGAGHSLAIQPEHVVDHPLDNADLNDPLYNTAIDILFSLM